MGRALFVLKGCINKDNFMIGSKGGRFEIYKSAVPGFLKFSLDI
jgi:hypothetical protein